jgi:hypothetical protein
LLRRSWGVVNRYCIWEGSSEVIIEYWRGREMAVKLIYADNPAEALMHFYYAERRRLVRCESVR